MGHIDTWPTDLQDFHHPIVRPDGVEGPQWRHRQDAISEIVSTLLLRVYRQLSVDPE